MLCWNIFWWFWLIYYKCIERVCKYFSFWLLCFEMLFDKDKWLDWMKEYEYILCKGVLIFYSNFYL